MDLRRYKRIVADLHPRRISMPDTQMSQGHRGAVRNPQTDGRLKHNRGNGVAKTQAARADVQHGGQGRVKNPSTDRRLKHNR
jgi:hypothetical protein